MIGEKKPPLRGGFFISLRLLLGLGTSHRQYWREIMICTFALTRNATSHLPEHGDIRLVSQVKKKGEKKTAFAGRFLVSLSLRPWLSSVSPETLAWWHGIELCLSLQRFLVALIECIHGDGNWSPAN